MKKNMMEQEGPAFDSTEEFMKFLTSSSSKLVIGSEIIIEYDEQTKEKN